MSIIRVYIENQTLLEIGKGELLKIIVAFGVIIGYGLFSAVWFSISASFIHPILGFITNPLFTIPALFIIFLSIRELLEKTEKEGLNEKVESETSAST